MRASIKYLRKLGDFRRNGHQPNMESKDGKSKVADEDVFSLIELRDFQGELQLNAEELEYIDLAKEYR